QPEHPVMQALVSGDREIFYEREIAERERSSMPPFGRLAALIISAATRHEAESHARALRRAAAPDPDIIVLGPAEAPMALVAGRHRFRLLVHGTRRADMQRFVRTMIKDAQRPRGSVRVQVDIDPQSFL
ncbi:MAG: primosomal protein N', partial [Rhizobiaceae bacterium]|nr:primosomal protein N' [Rhizobiaceae bacterium]